MKYEFTQDKTGCPNGRDVVEFKKGEVIEGEKVGEYLFAKWLEQGIIKKVKKDEENGNEGEDKTEKDNTPKELTEEEIGELVFEAKELLDTEDPETINFDKLKEIGIALKISGMFSAQKPQTIMDKINNFIDEYEEVDEGEDKTKKDEENGNE